jgi:tricorn protease interacting factor F2/3
MENWGAITFRENLLLRYEHITSRAGEERICEVIAHEIAHHWFGNLVSPSDWKYLWLNESFATYFGFMVVNHYHPEWETWYQFIQGETDRAFERDALLQTFPIELPGEEPVVINVSTSPIIYNKGASILRQVEGYIGTDTFREGLRHYLKKHAYACAASQDLWKAFEEVSGGPITRMMKSWVDQPGFPLLEVRREGTALLFTQRRFTYLPDERRQKWLIPVTVKVFYERGNSAVITTLMEEEKERIDVGDGAVAYKVNYGQTGFYRVKYYEEKNLEELGKRVSRKELPPEDRWGLQNDLYALFMSGDGSIEKYLDFLSSFADEDAYLPLISIAANLFHAYRVMEGVKRERIAAVGKSFCEHVLSRIGYEPEPSERHTVSILRDQIMYPAVQYGSESVKEFAGKKFSALMKGDEIHRDILRSVMQVGAWNGNGEVFGWFDRRFKSSSSEDERITILVALGCFRDRVMIEKIQQYTLKEVPDRNRFIPIRSLAANPYAIPFMWEWYVASRTTLEQLHPDHYERVIEAIVPVCGLSREEEVKAFFSQYVTRKESTRDVIKLSLEKLAINARMKKY